jgi:hypothetical protein
MREGFIVRLLKKKAKGIEDERQMGIEDER